MRKLFPLNQCAGLTQLVAFESLKLNIFIILFYYLSIIIDNNKKRRVILMKIEVFRNDI